MQANHAFNGHEKDGIKRASLGLSGDWQASDDLKLGFNLRRAKEDYTADETNLTPTGYQDYLVDTRDEYGARNEFTGTVWGEYSMLDGRMLHRLELQDSVFKENYHRGPKTRGETRALKYRFSTSLDGQQLNDANHLLNVMIERIEDENDAASDYSRANNSVALEYRAFLENGLDLQAGIRRDNFDSFPDFTSWNLGLSWQVPNSAYRLHASAGRGLVKPSYYELFGNDSYTLGNPGLKPEGNTGFDIGIEAQILDGRGMIDLTYFNERMEDEITYVSGAASDGSGRASFVNLNGKSPREGIEISGQLEATDALHLGLNYTYLDAKNPDGSIKIRRPRHELGLRASYELYDGRGLIAADLRHVSGNYDTQYWGAYETKEIDSYTVVNVSGGYDINQNLRATARVVNLFDKQYMEAWGYASQGRTAYVGLEAKW